MKRNIFIVTAILFFAAGFLSSCKDDNKDSSKIAVKSVKFSKSTLALPLGDEDDVKTVALTYELEPANANNIESVKWSSNAQEIATVSQSGLVTSLSLGDAIITVEVKTTDGATIPAKCTVNVVPPPTGVTGVEFEAEGQILPPGSSVKLIPIILPADAANKNVVWGSNKVKIATVNQEGLVIAAADTFGIAVITVTTEDGQHKAKYAIDVRVAVTGVNLVVPSKLDFEVGEAIELKANVLPTNATYKDVTWKSSDTKIATVDNKGKVQAVGIGKATITVTTEDGEFEGSCEVEVKTTVVTGIELESNAKMTLDAGNEVTLKANVLPKTATNQKIIWESSNPTVATVDANGKVKGIDEGTVFITVTSDEGAFTDTREIEVKRIPVTAVYVVPNITSEAVRVVYEGINNVFNITTKIEPSDATIKTVTWESSDNNVAIVDGTGKLTIKGLGKATITVTTADGGFQDRFLLNIGNFNSWLDRSKWSIYGYNSSYDDNRDGGPGWSSQAPYDGGARVTAILTDNDGQFWHASWSSPATDYPHWFIVDLGETVDFDAVMLRRRTDNGGTAKGYTIYTSDVANPPGNSSWINRGDYTFDPGTNNRQAKPLNDGTVSARYILMYFDAKYKGSSNYAMFSQFGLYKKE